MHCNYDACQGVDCKEDTCGSSRLRRETISLKANIVGRGHVSKGSSTISLYDLYKKHDPVNFIISGPIVARSNPKDVITIQDYQFFGFLNLGIGIIIGLILCFAILLLVRTIKSLSRSKKPSKKQS